MALLDLPRGLKPRATPITRAPSLRAHAINSAVGDNSSGEAILSWKSNRAAACTHEVRTLFESPSQATLRP